MTGDGSSMDSKAKQRIVVGVDGSPGANVALAWAIDEAATRGATLVVLMAWDFPMWPYYVELAPPTPGEFEAAAQKTLDELLATYGSTNVPVEARLVEASPAHALIDASADADLLVVGSRGRGWFVGALLGSVSLHCMQHARCPVVVVPGAATPS